MLSSLISLMCLLASIVLHFIYGMPSISMSVIPTNAKPEPGTTKNLHSLSLLVPENPSGQ